MYGSLNKPNLYLASSIRRQAWSISVCDTLPSFNDLAIVLVKPSATMSISTPAFRARADTSCKSPIPCSIISLIPVKSVTTKPSNPHCLRSTSVINHLLAVAGTPSTSLNEAITLPTPASTAALYGYMYSFIIRLRLISTVL